MRPGSPRRSVRSTLSRDTHRKAPDTPAPQVALAHRRRASDTDAVIRGLARLVLLRFLPRRLLPVLTAWEILQLVRNRRRAQATRQAQADAQAVPAAGRPLTRRPPRR
jgi:hypothetical protein